jgi:hypothetical protein
MLSEMVRNGFIPANLTFYTKVLVARKTGFILFSFALSYFEVLSKARLGGA